MPPRVLVVDNATTARDQLAELLGPLVAELAWASREAAPEQLRAAAIAGQAFDAVVLEAEPGVTAAVVRELATAGNNVRVVLLASDADGVAIAAQCGATDVVVRPFEAAELAFRLGRAPAPGGDARNDKRRPRKTDILVGTGLWIKELYDRIAMVAATDVAVAIFGESGTGKELVARTIHNASPRHDAPFVVVNCAAIPEALLEDELFGHVRGAFSDAARDREGLIAAADTGTVFLDEIGDLPLVLQDRLVRVLQAQEVRRIGDDHDRRVDVRIVIATNRDLEQLVARGSFRRELYERITAFPIQLPPLRDRPEDIALLVHHFIGKYRDRLGKPIEGIAPASLRRFTSYDWPGNVRELENKVHQAIVTASGPMIAEGDVALPASRMAGGRPDVSRSFRELKQEMIDGFEKSYLTELLRVHRGNLAQAARAASMDRKNLWALVVRHQLDREQFKKP